MSDDSKNPAAMAEAEDPALRAFRVYQAALAAHREKADKGLAETMPLSASPDVMPADGRR
ncbi:hypothetical protein GTP81_05555 [Rugamonas sp. FT107W]|uniref:Uncharacterized protein n=1 Tax=Duganella vulcania TaxID=2692166 RepID=A0A845HBK2_9BURK|nr:hypothetical protein [Duganella vulcania]MYN16210.1 hypothetical protein [Duganella vulcania]